MSMKINKFSFSNFFFCFYLIYSEGCQPKKGLSRLSRSRVQRRNTMDCAILNQMFIDEDTKRSDKRAQALLRESERDFKQSLAPPITAVSATNSNVRYSKFCHHQEETTEQQRHHISSRTTNAITTATANRNSGVPTLVESCNRYMSVSSRPVGCRASAPPSAFSFSNNLKLIDTLDTPKLLSRKQFHETFANLIKLGSIDRQDIKVSMQFMKIRFQLESNYKLLFL